MRLSSVGPLARGCSRDMLAVLAPVCLILADHSLCPPGGGGDSPCGGRGGSEEAGNRIGRGMKQERTAEGDLRSISFAAGDSNRFTCRLSGAESNSVGAI